MGNNVRFRASGIGFNSEVILPSDFYRKELLEPFYRSVLLKNVPQGVLVKKVTEDFLRSHKLPCILKF